MLNSDSKEYWGRGHGNFGGVEAAPFGAHGHPFSLTVTLPPLGVVFFKSEAPTETVEPDVKAAEVKPARRPSPRRKAAPKKAPTERPPVRKKAPKRGKRNTTGEPGT